MLTFYRSSFIVWLLYFVLLSSKQQSWISFAFSLYQHKRHVDVFAFQLCSRNHHQYTISRLVLPPLWAQNKGKQQKKTSSSSVLGGGFGIKSTTTTKRSSQSKTTRSSIDNNRDNDDYSIFPKLDSKVLDTLVPSVPVLFDEAGELPDEIYDRLSQIYGFPNFNYESSGSSTTTLSLQEMMRVSSATTTTSTLDELLDNNYSRSSTESSKTNLEEGKVAEAKLDCIEQLPTFTKFRVLHIDPMVLAIDNFFTTDECDKYVAMCSNSADESSSSSSIMSSRSPTVGKDSYAKAQRTSTTFYNMYESVPELMAKATRLLGLTSIHQWEEPQIVRYRKNEKFTWHLDALGPNELIRQQQREGKGVQQRQKKQPGQRLATLLVYLTDLRKEDGGATVFRDLRSNSGALSDDNTSKNDEYLAVSPKKGTALLFFPAAGGIPETPYDIRTLHCGQVVSSTSSQDKWISQLWLRAGPYQPTAPPGNQHTNAFNAITEYCNKYTI